MPFGASVTTPTNLNRYGQVLVCANCYHNTILYFHKPTSNSPCCGSACEPKMWNGGLKLVTPGPRGNKNPKSLALVKIRNLRKGTVDQENGRPCEPEYNFLVFVFFHLFVFYGRDSISKKWVLSQVHLLHLRLPLYLRQTADRETSPSLLSLP